MNIIFATTMYPILFVFYFVFRYMGKTGNQYTFGVYMKPEWLADDEVQAAIADYRQDLKRMLIAFAAVPVVIFFVPYASIVVTFWMIWLTAVIVLIYLPYVKAYRKIAARKVVCGWNQPEGEKKNLVELKSAGKVRRVRLAPFLPPIALSAAAAVFCIVIPAGKELPAVTFAVVTIALTTLLLYGVAVWIDRQKTEVISEDSEVNLNYARAKKNVWKNFWLAAAWFNTLSVLFTEAALMWFEQVTAWLLWESIGYSIVILVLAIGMCVRLAQVDKSYARMRQFTETDDDAHWLWGGLFYYNKNDRHILVSKRVGIGTTFNMGSPVGMGITVFCTAIYVILVPAVCALLVAEEFTPISLAVENEALIAEHWKVEYEIPLSDIIDAELLEEHPRWSKVNGTGLDHLSKGTYRIRNEGNVEVLMDPQNNAFLRVETADGVYWLSDASDAGTREIYDLIE